MHILLGVRNLKKPQNETALLLDCAPYHILVLLVRNGITLEQLQSINSNSYKIINEARLSFQIEPRRATSLATALLSRETHLSPAAIKASSDATL